MKVTTEELEHCELLMTVEIEPNREQDLLKKAAQRIARQVRVPGFRPGKAPYNVVVWRFGLEAVQQEALEQSADKVIQEALEEANVQPFAQIQLESINWDPLTIKLKIPTQPKVELNEYRDIRLEGAEIVVSEEDINQALKNLQEQNATWVPVDRPAQLGDLVSMSVVEKAGDEILAEREAVEHELVAPQDQAGEEAQKPAQPDLVTPLLGLSAGEEKSFTLLYPQEVDDKRYAGKEITFEVKVSSIKAKELDPLDDEFAKSVSDFDTLDELTANIRDNIWQQRRRQQDFELGNQALEKIVEESTIIWPAAFEEESVEQEIESLEGRIKSYGLTLDKYLQMENKTKEQLQTETRERVIKSLKRTLAVGKIAQQENLQISESEVLQRAKLISDYSGYGDQLWRGILGSQAQQNIIAADLLVEKVGRWLGLMVRGEEPVMTDETEEGEGEVTAEVALPGSQVEPVIEPVVTLGQAESSLSMEPTQQVDLPAEASTPSPVGILAEASSPSPAGIPAEASSPSPVDLPAEASTPSPANIPAETNIS